MSDGLNSETQKVISFIALWYYCIQIVMLSVELDISKAEPWLKLTAAS